MAAIPNSLPDRREAPDAEVRQRANLASHRATLTPVAFEASLHLGIRELRNVLGVNLKFCRMSRLNRPAQSKVLRLRDICGVTP
jgi:hypothetical protein